LDDQGTTETRGGVRFRKLRIAWSVAWGILCLLLCVLWVRSYSFLELFTKIDGDGIKTTIGSEVGTIYLARFDAVVGYRGSINSSASHDWKFRRGSPVDSNFAQFAWKRKPGGFYVALPHWSLAASAALAGRVIWFPWFRWRFRLRTLLIGMTVVAAILGAVLGAVR
jgi:hypothetical protein